MPSLIVCNGKQEGLFLPLGKKASVVGRDESLPLQVEDDKVSRRHVQVRFEPSDGRYRAVDMKSTNGTLLWSNPAHEALTGRKLMALIGRTVEDIWPKKIASAIRLHDNTVIEKKNVTAAYHTAPVAGRSHQRFTIRFPILHEGEVALVGALGIYGGELRERLKSREAVELTPAKEVSLDKRAEV